MGTSFHLAAEREPAMWDALTVSMRMRLAAALIGLIAVSGCAGTATEEGTAGAGGSQPVVANSQYVDLAPAEPTTDLGSMTVEQLPPEGIETLELIASDGPFAYDQDGSTFNNREGILPQQPRGFYAEYTVITPDSDDRGARRIVAGDDGSRFYTSDHYSSFREVVSG
ncbi:MAG TPA: ribonuclease domain-containing protein [Candidatus Limnocylindrales bacterium]|nr:ribonuclease domain-containing protein [Candidatus Limnocylindrales bacterium]